MVRCMFSDPPSPSPSPFFRDFDPCLSNFSLDLLPPIRLLPCSSFFSLLLLLLLPNPSPVFLVLCMIRRLAHFVYGLVSVFAPPHIAVLMFVVFVLYELLEYLDLCDTVYVDLRDYGAGLWAGVLLQLLF